jgi:hypothetical protein
MDILQNIWRTLQSRSMLCPDCVKRRSELMMCQVTLGLCLVGAVPFLRGGLVFIAQMLGAMASAGVVKALFPGPLAVTTSLSGGTSTAQGLFIEMVSIVRGLFAGSKLTPG